MRLFLKNEKKWSHISFEIVSSPEECIFSFHSKKRGYGVAFLTIDCNVVFSTFWIISIDAAREMIKLSWCALREKKNTKLLIYFKVSFFFLAPIKIRDVTLNDCKSFVFPKKCKNGNFCLDSFFLREKDSSCLLHQRMISDIQPFFLLKIWISCERNHSLLW